MGVAGDIHRPREPQPARSKLTLLGCCQFSAVCTSSRRGYIALSFIYQWNQNGFIDFVTGFSFESTVSTVGSCATFDIPEMPLENVASFVNLTEVAGRLENMVAKSDFTKLDARSQRAISTFLKKHQTFSDETSS